MADRNGALIVGGTSGIGLAAARRFLTDDCPVVLGGLTEEGLASATASLAEAGLRPAGSVLVDVRDTASVGAGVTAADHLLGGALHIVVNTAGVFPRLGLDELPESVWLETIDVNLSGTYRVCHAAAPVLIGHGGGVIVNIGSIWASHRWPARSAYAASKAGVEQFTRAVALELGPRGVRVNAVSPGIMRTAMTAAVLDTPAFTESFMPKVTLGRVGDPYADLAGVIRFLASDDAAYMSGEVVTVHGGYY